MNLDAKKHPEFSSGCFCYVALYFSKIRLFMLKHTLFTFSEIGGTTQFISFNIGFSIAFWRIQSMIVPSKNTESTHPNMCKIKYGDSAKRLF